MKWKNIVCHAVAGAALLASTTVMAESSYLPSGPMMGYVPNHPLLVPAGSSIFAPVAYGANLGEVYASVEGVNRYPGGRKVDGSLAIGAGLGNGDKYLGADVTVLVDTLGYRHSFGKQTGFGFKVFRWLNANTSVAAGANDFYGWNDYRDYATSLYSSVTHLFQVKNHPVSTTFGMGSGSFYSPSEFRAGDDSRWRPFGSAAVEVMPRTNFIVDYTGEVFASGVSLMPVPTFPAVVTAYAGNLGGPHKVSGPINFGLRASIGYAFNV